MMPDTNDAIAQRRRLAQALMGQGTSTEPVGHWTQAAARVAQALSGSANMGYADSASKARETYDTQQADAKQGANRAYAEGAVQRAVQQKMQLAQQAGLQPGSPEFKEYVYGIKQPDPNADLDRRYKEAQIQALSQKGAVENTRMGQLEKLGLDPESAEGIAFLANGKLPASVIDRRIQDERRAATAPNIAAGLQNLNKMADQYDDPSFENAVGPIQGAPPDGGLLTAPFANIARGFGEVMNMAKGGNANPSEVRSNIQGSTESLAAAIKPLIRAPGEGVWTDADQARLVAVVGDLAQARNKEEYRRRLNAVRDRVKSNFNLDIQFDANGQPVPQPPQQQGPRPQVQQPQNSGQPPVPGARQSPNDGNWYVPDPNRPGKYLRVE
jgi:hypothetical protein